MVLMLLAADSSTPRGKRYPYMYFQSLLYTTVPLKK